MLGIIFDCVCAGKSHIVCVAYVNHTTLLVSLAAVAHSHDLVVFLDNFNTHTHTLVGFLGISTFPCSVCPADNLLGVLTSFKPVPLTVFRSHNAVRAHNDIWRCWRLHDGVGDGGIMVVMLGIILYCVCSCRSYVICVASFCHTTLLC